MANSTCSIDSCDNPVRCKGMCNRHYRRELDRRGKPATRPCQGCGADIDLFEPGAAGRKRRNDVLFCDSCKPARAAARDRRAAGTANPITGVGDQWCRRCGKTTATRRYCSECSPATFEYPAEWKPCAVCSLPIDMGRRDKIGRKRRRDVKKCDWCNRARLTRHKVSIGLVINRDGITCGICSEPVDTSLSFPHPGSATVDHIVPISLGGDLGIENAQLSHLRCNQIKQQRAKFIF